MRELKNRLIMPTIKLGYSNGKGEVTDQHLEFYRARNKHIGAIIPEPLYMDPGLRELPTQLGIDSDDKIPGLKELNLVIQACGAKSFAHLNHSGRMANPKIPGNYHWSSTDQACSNGGAKPLAMNKEMMDKVTKLFVESAIRAEKAGFDGIEVQFGHGYLMAQFISPAVNHRQDDFGGNFSRRTKFPVQVAKAIRQATTLPLIARVSGDEMIPDGIHPDEMIRFSGFLEKIGFNALHISTGSACETPPWFFQHMFTEKGKTWKIAEEIEQAVKLPVIFVGQINRKEDYVNLAENHPNRLFSVGRAMVADEEFAGKILGYIKKPVRPCLACSDGCLGGVKKGQGLGCMVNPRLNTRLPLPKKAQQIKKIAIVGGGLAGLEAAVTLCQRGHEVELFEKGQLGGQFNLAPLTPKKRSMEALIPFYHEEMERLKIPIIRKDAKASDLIDQYDSVVLATGSIPRVLDIPGLTDFYWADILEKEPLPTGKRVLIIGGGLIGVDIATALIPGNNQIIMIKRTEDFGEDMEMIAKSLSVKMLKEKKTIFMDHTHLLKIEGNQAFVRRKEEDLIIESIDLYIVSVGMDPLNMLAAELKNKIPIHIIGDARKVGKAQDAILDGYRTAIQI